MILLKIACSSIVPWVAGGIRNLGGAWRSRHVASRARSVSFSLSADAVGVARATVGVAGVSTHGGGGYMISVAAIESVGEAGRCNAMGTVGVLG